MFLCITHNEFIYGRDFLATTFFLSKKEHVTVGKRKRIFALCVTTFQPFEICAVCTLIWTYFHQRILLTRLRVKRITTK